MDFHSVIETFAEAWVAANTQTPLTEAAEQGLINGPANHPTSILITCSNSSSNSQSSNINPPTNSSQPVLTLLQDSSKIQSEIIPPEINRCNGRLSPSDSSINDLIKNPKSQDTFGKCLPVHCIIEQIPGPEARGQHVELDSYAIVPNDTLFTDLVRTALGKLGYSVSQMIGAKSSIQVKKWKPLALDQITDNPEATVGDILGELTFVASLHVRLYSVPDNPQEWKDVTVRNAVLELLREMSQSKLASICPLSQPMVSNITNNKYLGRIGKEKCQEFGQWYLAYRKDHPEKSSPEVVPTDRPADGRQTFHPTKELPIMRDWFQACRNPSTNTLQMYVDILNRGPVRQLERPKVIFSTLKNWWKNEKQRVRKSQRSEDDPKSPTETKPKRRKKTYSAPSETSLDNSATSPFNSNPDSPVKSNNFTLINHSENESNDLDTPLVDRKLNNFTMINHGENESNDLDTPLVERKLNSNNFTMIDHNDSNDGESPKDYDASVGSTLNSMCLDHPHDLFTFPQGHCDQT